MKQLIFVVTISILIGIGIFFFFQVFNKNSSNLFKPQIEGINSLPSPTPSPQLPPINSDSNLEEETKKLTPPDFSKDFEDLENLVK